jgi:hypothetical protein
VVTNLTPNPTVVIEEIDDDICLYRPDTDEVLVLNHTAADVWRLADASVTADELVTTLARAYAMPPEQVHDDIVAVLNDLHERGFLV